MAAPTPSSLGSPPPGGTPAPPDQASRPPSQERVLGDRFLLVQDLGASGGWDAHLAEDLLDGSTVVVKTAPLAGLSPGVRLRIERDAQALRDVAGLFVAPAVHHGYAGDALYVVRPFVEGITLREKLAEGALTPEELRALAEGVLIGLREAHGRGVVDVDLRPSNVIVNPTGPLARVSLVDLAIPRRVPALADEVPRWASPEHAGLIDHEAGPASDLYLAGLLLFEAAVGPAAARPAEADRFLRHHLRSPAPSLGVLGVDLPAELEQLLQGLLRKDPRSRPADAPAALDALAPGGAAAPPRGAAELSEPPFVGREQELAALDAELAALLRGRAGFVLVEGESGEGKTRLLDEFARAAVRRGAWVVRGAAPPPPAAPLAAFRAVAEEVRRAASEPALREALSQRLGPRGALVGAVAPELAQALGLPLPPPARREAHGEARALRAVAALLAALGEPGRPAVVLLDDLHLADRLTLRALDHWRRMAGEAGRGDVLVVVAFRGDAAADDGVLRRLEASTHLALTALHPDAIRALATGVAGDLPDEVLALVDRLSGGNPFLAGAVLRGLTELGAVVPGPVGWVGEPGALARAQGLRRAGALLMLRLERLPPEGLHVLSAGAVLGPTFDPAAAAELARLPPAAAMALLQDAAEARLLRAMDREGQFAFHHERVREAVLDRLPADQRGDLHRLAAERRLRDGAPPGVVASHLAEAGEPAAALPHALAAAAAARRAFAFDAAERAYRIAERGAAGAAERLAVHEGLGDVLALLGRDAEAAGMFERALAAAPDAEAQARLRGKAAAVAVRAGDAGAAAETLTTALRGLGERVPGTAASAALALALGRLRRAARAAPPAADARAEAKVALLRQLAGALEAQGGPAARVRWAEARAEEVGQAAPGPVLADAIAAGAEGLALRRPREHARAGGLLERAAALGAEGAQPHRAAERLRQAGSVDEAAGRHDAAVQRFAEAAAALEAVGDVAQAAQARWQLALALLRRGERPAAVEAAQRAYRGGLEAGDPAARAWALAAWALAAEGREPEALVAQELEAAAPQVRAPLLLAQARRLLARGDPASAAERLAEARRWAARSGWTMHTAPVLPWYATALHAQAEATSPLAAARGRRLAWRLSVAAAAAVRLAGRFPAEQAHAWRAKAAAAALHRRSSGARRALERSRAAAEDRGLAAELAETLRFRARLARILAWPEAAEAEREAREALDRVPSVAAPIDSRSLDERFGELLEAGRRIVSATSPEGIARDAHEATLQALRADQAEVLRVDWYAGRATWSRLAGSAEVGHSAVLLERAVEQRRPVTFSEARPGRGDEALLRSGVHAALCAPIQAKGRAVGAIYAARARSGSEFTQDDQRVAELLANLTGAALETAQGFTDLRAANERLRELDAAKTRFLNVVAHELFTPLTPLRMQVQLLRTRAGGEATARQWELLERNIDRLGRLVEDLLDVSRIEAGRLTLSRQPLRLDRVAVEVARSFEPAARAAGLALSTEVSGALGVQGDPTRLTQVLFNLLSNAVKFTPRGGSITVQARAEAGTALVRVRDTGRGLRVEDVPHLFRPFAQVRQADGRGEGGTGLGLHISKGIVEAHGGRIWAESEGPGRGATFTIALPLAED